MMEKTARTRALGRVEAMLPRGERNAIRSADLAAALGLASNRQLQSVIEGERMRGALILSTGRGRGGYYLPSEGEMGRQEIAAFIRTVNSRAVHSQMILKAARRALRECAGQEGISDA